MKDKKLGKKCWRKMSKPPAEKTPIPIPASAKVQKFAFSFSGEGLCWQLATVGFGFGRFSWRRVCAVLFIGTGNPADCKLASGLAKTQAR